MPKLAEPLCESDPTIMAIEPVAFADLVLKKTSDIKEISPEPGVVRRVGAGNENILLIENRLSSGYMGAVHSHPHDQVVYVVSGSVRLNCCGQTVDFCAGESFAVRGGIQHQIIAMADAVVLDVFAPCREEFL